MVHHNRLSQAKQRNVCLTVSFFDELEGLLWRHQGVLCEVLDNHIVLKRQTQTGQASKQAGIWVSQTQLTGVL